jgi:hypothetical protein
MQVPSAAEKKGPHSDLSMSVFVFDQDTIAMIRYILAIQRFKEYSVGPQGLNKQLCALSFEKVLIQTALKYPKFQKENPCEICLRDVVRFLQQKNLVSPALAIKLGEYVDFHDSQILARPIVSLEEANAKAKEMLQFLCTAGGINENNEIKNSTFEEIATLKTKQPIENTKCEIAETDFDNLDQLYIKCPSIQREIEKRLKTPLRSAQLSGFAPNTGGIWLPFTTTSDRRRPIDRASVGVTFTPIEIRIGLDFGSQAHKYRAKYYELLLNGELADQFESLSRKATGYCLCDTFWYYHIRNIQSLQWCLTLYGSTKAAIERAIEETNQLEGNPLTAHRYLISKVIHRKSEDFSYVVNGLFNEISKDLDDLYPMLEKLDKLSP